MEYELITRELKQDHNNHWVSAEVYWEPSDRRTQDDMCRLSAKFKTC